jgi:hypothetical protein
MRTRQSLILGSAVVAAALILGAFFGPRTAAQKAEQPGQPAKAEQPAAVGRYQVRQEAGNQIVVIDTTTGQCWYKTLQANVPWEELGSPGQPKK